MVFTASELGLRDRQFASYDSAPAGSQVRLLTAISGTIVIGSVSATVDAIYVQSGAEMLFALSGTNNQTNPVGVSGIVNVSGTTATINTIQSTDPWITLGSTRIIPGDNVPILGSVFQLSSPGSISVYEAANPLSVQQARGVFGFSGVTFHASGTANVMITPGTGSNIILKGFTASSDDATIFRLLFSGGAVVGTYTLGASGNIVFNMAGMEPSGALNEPMAVGTLSAGSLNVTVFTADSL